MLRPKVPPPGAALDFEAVRNKGHESGRLGEHLRAKSDVADMSNDERKGCYAIDGVVVCQITS